MKNIIVVIMFTMAPLFFGCADVYVVKLADNKVVGTLRPSLLGTFRDILLNVDAETGRFAVIEWGRHQSTVKLVSIAPWSCETFNVDIGRENGLGGAEYCDINNRLYLCHNMTGLYIFDDKGGRKAYRNPIPKGYWPSKIVPCKGGYLIKCGKVTGDDCGAIVYRFTTDSQTLAVLYKTDASISGLWVNENITFFEDERHNYNTTKIVDIDYNGKVKQTRVMEFVRLDLGAFDGRYIVTKNDGWISIHSTLTGARIRDIKINLANGEIAFDMVLVDDMVVLSLRKSDSPKLVFMKIALDGTKQERFASPGCSLLPLRPQLGVKHQNERFVILNE